MNNEQALKLARSRLLAYIVAMNPDYEPGRHHRILCDKLDAAMSGTGPRFLAVSMPPRHGKSEICSKWLPSFFLGTRPKDEVMAISYAADLALDFGGAVRGIMSSGQYSKLFPDSIAAGRSSSGAKWSTASGGKYKAAGVSGGITGFGANLLIIDDPVKNRATAHSRAYKEMIKTFFGSTLFSRLLPDCIVLIVMTRWTEDDLIGFVLKELEGWEYINMEAICETPENDPLGRSKGQALWPEWYDEKRLLQIKSTMRPASDWNALYQGNPTSASGEIFKLHQFYSGTRPEIPITSVASWDTAAATHESASFSAGTFWDIYQTEDENGVRAYAAHCFGAIQGHWEFLDMLAKVREKAQSVMLIERASTGISLAQTLRLPDQVVEIVPHGDRVLRAKDASEVLQARDITWNMTNGNVLECIEVMLKYPAGSSDDYVSSVAQFLRWFNAQTVFKQDTQVRFHVKRAVKSVRRSKRMVQYS